MAYLEDFEKLLKERCHQNEVPGCTAACPFRLNIKDIIAKLKKGRFNAAHRVFQNTVGFPAIVAAACDRPCREKCMRNAADAAVDLHALEQAMCRYATRKDPNAYNLPARAERVAVVGAGISGLACALLLCNKKYQVTVFEKSDHIGGSLRDAMDAQLFDEDVQRQFQYEKYECVLSHEVRSIEELAAFDAVYVATGAQADGLGLAASGTGAFATDVPGVFFGGSMRGRTHMQALSDGLLASRAIERYLKTGLMNQPEEEADARFAADPSRYQKKEPVLAANGRYYTEEEAVREAERCELCSCDACMRACDLMRHFDKTPRRIYEEVYVTIRPGTLSRDGTMATRLISTCNRCGVCRSVCPEHIDFGAFFEKSMEEMKKKGAMPWAFHDFWLRDMAFSNGEAACTVLPPGKTEYLFFPGCQLGASDPAYVSRTYAWLREELPGTALHLSCCGIPAQWAGEQELHKAVTDGITATWERLGRLVFILSCPTCMRSFDRYLPGIRWISLYELMAERPSAPALAACREPLAVFDACAAADHPQVRTAVRQVLQKAGIPYEEIPHEDGSLPCCSFGGHAGIAAQRYSERVIERRAAETDRPIVAYCANCRDSFASKEKEAVHILDLLFGLNAGKRPAPTVTERRKNRIRLKRELARVYLGEEPQEEETMKLYISEELKQRMSADLILESDVAEVIRRCEEEDRKLMDPQNGHFIGHKKIMNMTYWTEYLPKEDGFEVFAAYAHRMSLEAEDTKNG